jgi:hypothetical protein
LPENEELSMKAPKNLLICMWVLSVVFACQAIVSAAEPAAVLYDAPEASVGQLAGQPASPRAGWTKLDEDQTAHAFKGCAVLANDKIVAVLAKDTAELDVYSCQAGELRLCARLQPVSGGRADLKRGGLTIQENSRGSVSLEVALASPGASRRIAYELSAGAAFIKTTAGAGVEKLRVKAPCRFAILPDFFGDDMVVDATTIPVPRADLPSENFLLRAVHGGDALVLTVSESRENDISIALSNAAPREIISSDISYGKKPHVWVAILAQKGIWHQHTVNLADAGKILDLEWKMPFPALWRVDWATADGLTESWEMLLQQPDGKYVMQNWFGQDESVGQRFGKEFGARDWNKPGRQRWNPVLGGFTFPCWVEKDGQGRLQPLKERRYVERGKVSNFDGPVVIYPMDRAKAQPFTTPIESLTVVDLVRMTLGVGPCQYILDLEGQKRNARGVATCYARDVINAIYKEGRQLEQKAVIDEQLTLCVAFITNVRERIDLYVKFGRDMTAYLEEQKRTSPRHAEFLNEMLDISNRLDQFFQQYQAKIRTPAYAQQTADGFRKDLLTYAEKDAYQKCAAQMGIFTGIGGAQDGLVASCRMIVKTLRQRAGIAMAVHPELKEIAAEVRNRTQAILRNPTPYEAPRH